MDIFDHLKSLEAKVADFMAAHPLDAQAQTDLANLVSNFANEGDALAKAETAKLPPALAPMVPQLNDLIDQADAAVRAEADAKIQSLAAAKASINS